MTVYFDHHVSQILMGRCQSQDDLGDDESEEAVTTQLQPYFPNPKDQTVFVSLSSAILLVNRSVMGSIFLYFLMVVAFFRL